MNTSIILIASGFIDEGVIETIKERHEIMIKYIQMSLIPDPALDAKGISGRFVALGA